MADPPGADWLHPTIAAYAQAHTHRPGRPAAATHRRDRRAGRRAGPDADQPRPGRLHGDARAAHGGSPGRRGRHVHRLLGPGRGPRPPRRRHAPVLRHQRGVDGDRPPLLGGGGRRRQDRPAHRAGRRHAARPPRGRAVRRRLRRRRQEQLRQLRGGAAAPAPPRRADHGRQHDLGRHAWSTTA